MKAQLAAFGFGTSLETALVRRCFTIEHHEPADPIYFGNSALVLRTDGLQLRFVRDRGDVFVEFSPGSQLEWIGLRAVTRLATPHLVHSDGIRLQLDLEDTPVHLLESGWQATVGLFSEEALGRTRAAVEEMNKGGVARFLERRSN